MALRHAGRRLYFPQGRSIRARSSIWPGALNCSHFDAPGITPDVLLRSSAGETQAGLVVGTKLLARSTKVIGIHPGGSWWDVPREAERFGEGTARRLGLERSVDRADVINSGEYAVGKRHPHARRPQDPRLKGSD